MTAAPRTEPTIAHKFGGSSLADPECIARVVDILLARDERQVVVVSALRGATDALIELTRVAAEGGDWQSGVDQLEQRHADAARALLGDDQAEIAEGLSTAFAELRDILHAQSLLGPVSSDIQQIVSGLGEIFSATIVDAAIRARGADCSFVDAREVLVIEPRELGATVLWDSTRERLARAAERPTRHVIVPGFVARTEDGRVTTLGRNGSDYSGAIFAALFDARELHIWSDVDGILSADPRIASDAVQIRALSYAEACELTYFGARVLHPQTMAPAIERGIAIIARNTFNPSHPGTRITAEIAEDPPVKGVTAITGMAILSLEGTGMVGVPGTAQRVFSALEQAKVSVVMISQASSEHSICCVIRSEDADAALKAVHSSFAYELANGQITSVTIERGIAALAAVGDGMVSTPGIAARLFSALGNARINVRAIAQGSSERSISIALDEREAQRAIRAVHAGFYLSAQTLSIGVVGPGNVGRAFLEQLQAARGRLLEQSNVDLRVRAVASSKRMGLYDPMIEGLDGPDPELDRECDLDALTDHVRAERLLHSVIVDCTASDEVADRYRDWLAGGTHVITANKRAGSGPLARYESLQGQPAQFRYEATVGAGLPIVATLRDLIDTGDRVLAIDGILSGTLAYLFHSFDGTRPFSELVREAMERGFTEPDPRDDLSGLDVARKLVILGRENGLRVDLEDVRLESLVPAGLRDVSKQEFLAGMGAMDEDLGRRLASARVEDGVIRHVAHLDADGAASVGLAVLPRDHALATTLPTDNVVQFTSERYRENPLVVRGPGAGPEVTAMGIFSDLLRVAGSLGSAR